MTATPDIDHLRQWIGRTQDASDVITAQLVKGLRATLFLDIGNPTVGDIAPFTTHWCLAQPVAPMSEIGIDGHPARGGFLPPVPLPRRMWAGGQIEFIDPLRVGDTVTRSSRISDVTMKTGSTGALCFVSVDHTITTPRGTAIRERHDIVYRDIPAPGDAKAAPAPTPAPAPAAKHRESHMADPVLLFRYSALASLLIEFAAKLRGGKPPAKFVYRGVSPLFDGAEFSVNGNETAAGLEVWTANAAGVPTMKGTAS
jgi:3-methylfumaryl-CoA hydratase